MEMISQGKVRDIYDIDNGKMVVVTSDRISAFDSVLPCDIPGKGMILNLMSAFWFDFTKDIIPNHMISVKNAAMPAYFHEDDFAERCMLVKKLKMLPIECIVRGYITGSGWKSYQKDGSVCGIKLPAGLQESERLPEPIYTPTTKAEEGHDEHITYEQTVEILGEDLAKQVRDKSIELYTKCAEYALTKGIIIADTKFEFGLDEDGNLVLADEVLTPDSSRFWPAETYKVGRSQESYDKQMVRDWLKSHGWTGEGTAPRLPKNVVSATSRRYIQAYEALTGCIF